MTVRTQLRYLRLHALISSGVILVVALGAFSQGNRKFDTIDVERINVIEKDGRVRLTVPYWHHGEAAQTVWREIWSYLTVLGREGGLRAYDPQLERVLSLDTDFDAVIRNTITGLW